MTGTIHHHGYPGSVGEGLLHGKLIGIRHAFTYVGKDVMPPILQLRKAVDEYLGSCDGEGKKPDKPFTESLNVCISPKLHRVLATRAEQKKKSLNAGISDILESSWR